MHMTLSEELTWRGFANQTTLKDIRALDSNPVNFYFGVDPSAASMQIGNLAAVMMVWHFIKHGHNATLLIGGATGLIGDPDGKAEERNLKSVDEISQNKKNIVAQYKSLLQGQKFDVVDNYDWFKHINYLEFLRDVGKHVPMRQMMGRDFVQTRLSEDGAGISYAEFSYVLIQAYDFLYLNEKHDVTLQVCGSDQWGNSIAGVDLIRRITGRETHVWSIPLVVNKVTGKKFGKTEGGAVWVSEKMTSAYQFYQFWLNVDDEGVEDYLKIYTILDKSKIELVMAEFNGNRRHRMAQRVLAYEVTKFVHGEKRANEIVKVTDVLFAEGNFLELGKEEKHILKEELGSVHDTGDLADVLVHGGLASSKKEARIFLASGAIHVNGQKAGPENLNLFVPGLNLVKRGKNTFKIVEK
jgi:tyrosyl-tRNA synthetase